MFELVIAALITSAIVGTIVSIAFIRRVRRRSAPDLQAQPYGDIPNVEKI